MYTFTDTSATFAGASAFIGSGTGALGALGIRSRHAPALCCAMAQKSVAIGVPLTVEQHESSSSGVSHQQHRQQQHDVLSTQARLAAPSSVVKMAVVRKQQSKINRRAIGLSLAML